MVTVIDFVKRKNTADESFNVLVLQGDLEMVQSKETGRYYATAKTCSISCTFNEVMCQALIGKSLPGKIEKMECDPYDYHIPGSDEIISLSYVYYYDPVDRTLEQEVFGKVAA